MKFNLIQIRKKAFNEKGFDVLIFRDNVDRQKTKTVPNELGFYYCPKRISVKKGFQDLKTKMIEDVDGEISRLEEYKKQLEELELPQ